MDTNRNQTSAQSWPFGHLSKAKASAEAHYIAESDMSSYHADATVVRELKRYLLLRKVVGRPVTMQSKEVDAAWHAFILDTRNYVSFGEQVFGEYLHHQSSHFALDEQFPIIYQELFGEELPRLWFEETKPSSEPSSYCNPNNCA